LNIGWCTPGAHAPERTGGNRRQRDTGFTLTTLVHAVRSVVLLRFNSPPRAQTDTRRSPRSSTWGFLRSGPRRRAAYDNWTVAARIRAGMCGKGPVARTAWRQAFLIAEISNSRVTLSLTRTPPASSGAFHSTP